MKAGNGGTGDPRKASAAMTGFSGTIKAKPRKRSGGGLRRMLRRGKRSVAFATLNDSL